MKGLIFTYVMTYGGAAVALFNPFIGLLAYCCFAIVRPEAMWHWSVPQGGSYSRIVAIGLLLGWIGKGFGDWNFGAAKWIVRSFFAYLAWAALSTLFATDYQADWRFIDNASKYALPWIVGVTTIRTQHQVQLLAWTLMFSQAYVAFHLNLEWVYGNRSLITYGFGNMDNNCVAIAMVAGAGLAFFLGITTSRISLRWAAFASAALMAHYPMFAESRGGMLGLIVVGFISFVLLPKSPRHYWYLVLAVAIGFRLAGPMVWDRFGTTFESAENRDTSAQSRLDLWSYAWDMIKRYPIFGVGPDNYPVVVVEYGQPLGKECHSLWFQIAAELGMPALILLMSFYLLTISHLWQFSRQALGTDPWQTAIARGIIASLVGFMVAAQFVSLEGLEFPYYVVMAGVGLLRANPAVEPARFNYALYPCPQPSL